MDKQRNLYTPTSQKERDAYERGMRSVMPYIIVIAIMALIVGFFLGRIVA